ncbi:MAG: type III-B CRISPR module RAMP protein Cmr4 [Cyanothece sp. SIO2G6]|nr:type III-B CRISPR module RAMP protein Cmr4 [Cyanothece sp. SIO2G6]
MYQKAYGIIETLAPLHVGASAGEETGNLNLIFRDQFTQTGIIPGSSIRGRFRADLRDEQGQDGAKKVDYWYGKEAKTRAESESNAEPVTSEGIVKFEYASLLWIPVYCPNQPVVRVSCPALLNRYRKILNLPKYKFQPHSYAGPLSDRSYLFFNLGFVKLGDRDNKLQKIAMGTADSDEYPLLVVKDTEMSMIHDMALYRQSRVSLDPDQKIAKDKAFFNVEALPEGTVMIFPMALRKTFQSRPVEHNKFLKDSLLTQSKEMYFGGLESVGFGRTSVMVNLLEEQKNDTATK